jgi:hypothetical protein
MFSIIFALLVRYGDKCSKYIAIAFSYLFAVTSLKIISTCQNVFLLLTLKAEQVPSQAVINSIFPSSLKLIFLFLFEETFSF